MTHDQVKRVIEKIKTDSEYPWKHELEALLQQDAEHRRSIELLLDVQETQASVIKGYEHKIRKFEEHAKARKGGIR